MAVVCSPAAARCAPFTGLEVLEVKGMDSIDAYAGFRLGVRLHSLHLGNSSSCGCTWALNAIWGPHCKAKQAIMPFLQYNIAISPKYKL